MGDEKREQGDRRRELANESHDPVIIKGYREVPLSAERNIRAVRDSIRDPSDKTGGGERRT